MPHIVASIVNSVTALYMARIVVCIVTRTMAQCVNHNTVRQKVRIDLLCNPLLKMFIVNFLMVLPSHTIWLVLQLGSR